MSRRWRRHWCRRRWCPASVRLWDVATRRWAAALTFSYSQRDGGVSSVAYSPDGKTLAMFSHLGHETCLWDPVTRKVTIQTDPGPGIDGTAGGFSSGGTTLVVADTDGRIYLWDLGTKHVTATLNVLMRSPSVTRNWLLPPGIVGFAPARAPAASH